MLPVFINEREHTLTLPQTRFQPLLSTMFHPGGRNRVRMILQKLPYYHSVCVMVSSQRVSVTEKQCVSSCWLFIPESIQSTVWIVKSSRQQLNSWVPWMIVAQVQLSQKRGVRFQRCGQRSTALLCDQTAWQPGCTGQGIFTTLVKSQKTENVAHCTECVKLTEPKWKWLGAF